MKATWQKLQKQCDILYQKVGLKDNPKCEVCGEIAEVIHHFIPKSLSSYLRYSKENGVPICNECHSKVHFQDPHINAMIIFKRGKEWELSLNSLRDRQVIGARTNAYYQKIKEDLENEL